MGCESIDLFIYDNCWHPFPTVEWSAAPRCVLIGCAGWGWRSPRPARWGRGRLWVGCYAGPLYGLPACWHHKNSGGGGGGNKFNDNINNLRTGFYFPIKIKALHSVLLPWSLDSVTILHSKCNFSTPWGSILVSHHFTGLCTCQMNHKWLLHPTGPQFIHLYGEQLVTGFCINSVLKVHFLHSLRSIPASHHFTEPRFTKVCD